MRMWLDGLWEWWLATLIGAVSGYVLSWHKRRWKTNRRRAIAVLVAITLVVGGTPFALRQLEEWTEDTDGRVLLVVSLKSRVDTERWSRVSWADPGDTVEFLMEVENRGPSRATDLAVGLNSSPDLQWVPHSLSIAESNHPDGSEWLDEGREGGGQHLLHGGLDIGHYSPGANVYLTWQMRVDSSFDEPGIYKLTNVAVAHAYGNPSPSFENEALIQVEA